MTISIAIGAIAGGGILVAGLIAMFAWIAHNPSRAERIAYWALSAVRFVSKKAEDRALASDITHRVNNFALTIEESVEGYKPVGLGIELVGDTVSEATFMDDGRLIVRMRPRKHRDHNFLTVATLYVAHTLFPRVKLQLRTNQTKALNLYATERLIRHERASLVDEFIRSWINPALVDNETLERLLRQLDEVDRAGMFLPVLCQELHLLGARMIGPANRAALQSELDTFVAFLQRIARRRTGDITVPLTYSGSYLRVAIQIVSIAARREAAAGDPGPWLRFALETHSKGVVDHVYFIGSGEDENRRLIERVADAFCAQAGWDVYAGTSYDGTIHDRLGNPIEARQAMVLCRSRAVRRIR